MRKNTKDRNNGVVSSTKENIATLQLISEEIKTEKENTLL